MYNATENVCSLLSSGTQSGENLTPRKDIFRVINILLKSQTVEVKKQETTQSTWLWK